ncbi:MAG: peptidoglycan DD-metalloendopeptidase family protein [Proteobacteria bacterium]|nr:peptidoglycan DD-metalloendopeptidase family protein [Pseudomonadota bacterium]
MKNIQIVIIPGHNENIRHVTINIFLFIGIIIILVLFLLFSTVFIIQNFTATKHISQISALRRENTRLREYKSDFEKRYEQLGNNYMVMVNYYKQLGNYIYSERMKRNSSANTFTNIDSLNEKLLEIKQMYSMALKTSKNFKHVPSIPPVNGRILFKFGNQYDPFTNRTTHFNGITVTTSNGAHVKAAAAGKIVSIEILPREGLTVIIRHSKHFSTKYGHLMLTKVHVGDYVKKGNIIGKSGETGRTIGPSLYYEIDYNGQPVDPEVFIKSYLKKDFYSFFNA